MAKAFDTVSIPHLLSKLKTLGIRGLPLKLLTNYLSNRKHRVKVENHVSDECEVKFGVPQGSILGPTLFLIYINGLCQLNLQQGKIFTFADDTALFFSGDNWNEFAQNHANWQLRHWRPVLLTDESRFRLTRCDGGLRVYRRPGERYSAVAVQEYDKFGCGSVMVWGGVSLDERTDLVVIPGRLCAQTYIENVLEDHVWPAAYGMGPDFLLMQDNARPHTTAITSDYLRQQEIRVMEWPSMSPDLNPIEHIWDLLDRRIRKRPIAPQALQQLTEALIEEWERIPQEDIRRIIRSMPRRCQAVIRAHGGHTRY
ncbi:unnamed protein product [Pieris macdunnoughi]|uniref:Reverse transcriptase domain-containing protein n=1 Tax=Pieris macdunnoughi TaxID=345717 RepID=A0A821X3N9_9NEOP|nr:unnamed protein product [Pieris macdunnoughi]